MKRKIVMAALCLLALAACKENRQEGTAKDYAVLTIAKADVATSEDYPATMQGRQDVDVYPQIAGKLTRVAVKEGQHVSRGQTLFVIDQVPYKAALQTAQANLRAAQAAVATAQLTYEGKKELFDQRVVSQFDLSKALNALHTAQAQQQQAEAMMTSARNDLSYTVVASPSDGVVGTLPFRVGALVSPELSQPLTTVSDNSQVYVYFSMPENRMLALVRQYGSMEKALKDMPDVRLRLNDGTLYPHSGRIESVSGVLDRQTGSASLRAVFPNAEGLLHSGGAGNVVIGKTLKGVVTIPQSATYELQDKVFAYRVAGDKAVETQIQVVPIPEKSLYVVTDGLKPGDVVVTEGVSMLQDGQTINVRK